MEIFTSLPIVKIDIGSLRRYYVITETKDLSKNIFAIAEL